LPHERIDPTAPSDPASSGPADGGAEWRNWTGDERCLPAAIERPGSVPEVVAALERAAEAGQRVRVAGSGHSFGDIALTDGRLLLLDRLDSLVDVDRSSGLVRAHAGITLRALGESLAEHSLAMENLGDVDAQTLAGAIATATHGTGARLRNLSSQLAALTLVCADGSTLECRPERDPELFRAACVGVGSLGVVVDVTLRCVPAFTLHARDESAPLEQALERFEELALGNDHFELYAFPYAERALTRTNNRTDAAPRPRHRARAYAEDVLLVNRAFDLACRAGRRFPALIPAINRLVTRLAGSSTRVDRSHRIFATPRLVRFTEMEYALPRERTAEAARRVLALVAERRLAVPFPIEVRTAAPDDAFLSTANGRETGYVAVHMFAGMPWEPYFRAVAEIMDELGGRPHWGKRHFHTAATLRPRYPDWDRFQAVRARLDPGGRFANAWSERVLGPVRPPSGP
jgi:FAD-linked oxidoreductase